MLFFALLLFLLSLAVCLHFVRGCGQMESLSACTVWADDGPLVSVVVAACNEAPSIESSLRSLLGQNYRNLQIIVVDDRSSDATGALIDGLAAQHPVLQTLHILELPDGWLGKCHALHQGAALAQGKYLLFCDADVCLELDTIGRAMARMEAGQLEHLSCIFRTSSPSLLLQAMVVDAFNGLFLLFKPWLVRKRDSKYFLGVGAFNLVRRDSYLAVGGHGALRMHPVDDIMLGKILKENGCACECLLGGDLISVPWYTGPVDMMRGLMKNSFALYHYHLIPLLAAAGIILTGSVLPLWLPIWVHGPAGLLFLLTVSCRIYLFAVGARMLGAPWQTVFFLPLTPLCMLFIMAAGAWYTLRQGGITWRGAFYPLAELKKAPPLLTLGWVLR